MCKLFSNSSANEDIKLDFSSWGHPGAWALANQKEGKVQSRFDPKCRYLRPGWVICMKRALCYHHGRESNSAQREGRTQEILVTQVTTENLRRLFNVSPSEVWLRNELDGTVLFPEELRCVFCADGHFFYFCFDYWESFISSHTQISVSTTGSVGHLSLVRLSQQQSHLTWWKDPRQSAMKGIRTQERSHPC